MTKVSKNYAGYNDKVNQNNEKAFSQFTDNLLSGEEIQLILIPVMFYYEHGQAILRIII